MINFVIIESDQNYQNQYINIIEKIMFNNNLPYEISSFKKYNNELQTIINNQMSSKIYLTEIDITGNISGIDIAKEIRQTDWNSEIIFITNHDKMFETVYRNIHKVFSFIEKFYDMNQRLVNDLTKIVNKLLNNKRLTIYNKKEYLQINLQDILYIYSETRERKIAIITKQEKYMVNMTLKEILSKCNNNFKQVHRACIVNTNEVVAYNWNQGYFKLKSGKQIRLCSKNYKDNL